MLLEIFKFKILDFLQEALSLKDVAVICLSLFSDGLSTTTPTLLFNLYCLAVNPAVQQRVYDEVDGVVGQDKVITQEHINKMPYLKAFIKETFRCVTITVFKFRNAIKETKFEIYVLLSRHLTSQILSRAVKFECSSSLLDCTRTALRSRATPRSRWSSPATPSLPAPTWT